MKLVTKIVLVLAVFVITFLAWPDFKSNLEYNCDGVSAAFLASGGECPIHQTHESAGQLGGGWRWLQSNVCVKDGKLFIASDQCRVQRDEARSLRFAFVGSVLTTVAVSLLAVAALKAKRRHG